MNTDPRASAIPEYRCATYHVGPAPKTTSSSTAAAAAEPAYTFVFSSDSKCAELRRPHDGHRHDDQLHGASTESTTSTSTSTTTATASSTTPPFGGFTETLHLYREPAASDAERWPHTIFCSWPDWMRGRWQHMEIDQSTVVYRDHNSFKTYTMRCVENEIGSERYLVISRTQW